MKIKAIVIDDIEKARIALISDLEDYCPNVEVIGQADGVASGIAILASSKPDVVFLDIKMGDGTGFDLIQQLQESGDLDFKVIFTTAYDEYAIKAFKFSALDYLLKPIDPEELIVAVEKVKPEQKFPISDAYTLLLENLNNLANKPKRLALSSTERIHVVEIENIVRCEAHKNYTIFFMLDKQQLVVTKTMKDYDEILTPQGFFRTHHSHLVNMNYVKEFVKIDGTYLLMKDGTNVPVSVRKKEGLLKQLSDF